MIDFVDIVQLRSFYRGGGFTVSFEPHIRKFSQSETEKHEIDREPLNA